MLAPPLTFDGDCCAEFFKKPRFKIFFYRTVLQRKDSSFLQGKIAKMKQKDLILLTLYICYMYLYNIYNIIYANVATDEGNGRNET